MSVQPKAILHYIYKGKEVSDFKNQNKLRNKFAETGSIASLEQVYNVEAQKLNKDIHLYIHEKGSNIKTHTSFVALDYPLHKEEAG